MKNKTNRKIVLGFVLIGLCLLSIPDALSLLWFGGKTPSNNVNVTTYITINGTNIDSSFILGFGFRYFNLSNYFYIDNAFGYFNETRLNQTIVDLSNGSGVWLPIADQRYNETGLVDELNSSKLNITDQRYNDSALVNGKLNESDQRYNETGLIDAINSSLNSSYLAYSGLTQNFVESVYNMTAVKFIGALVGQADTANSSLFWDALNSPTDITGIGVQAQNLNMGTQNITNVTCISFVSGGLICDSP